MAIALRLFDNDLPEETDWARCTLRDVFERWFIPQVLEDPEEREEPAAPGTITLYRDALKWWEGTTGNPRTGEITRDTLRAFIFGLKTSEYRRGVSGRGRLLSASSRNKHKKQIRAILRRLVKGAEPPSLPILEARPKLKTFSVDQMPKPTPEWAHFKMLIDRMNEINFMRGLLAPPHVQPVHFWRALLATLYCCGWRLGTTLALDWSWLTQGEVLRIELPSKSSVKTGKWDIRPAPSWLIAHWHRQTVNFRAGDFPTPTKGLIFGQKFARKRLLRSWERIQRKLAPKSRVYSFQALRRLHGDTMTAVGYDVAKTMAQLSLQHADAKTTQKHYARIVEAGILRLPEV